MRATLGEFVLTSRQRHNKPQYKMEQAHEESVSKVPRLENRDEKESESYLAMFLRNPAFHFIVEKICGNLTASELAKCHCVSKIFHSLLAPSRPWWISQLRFIRNTRKTFRVKGKIGERRTLKKEFIEEQFPYWRVAFDNFENNKLEISKLQDFVKFMKTYLMDTNIKYTTSPTLSAITQDRTDIFNILVDPPLNMFELLEEEPKESENILFHACDTDNLEILKLFQEKGFDLSSFNIKGENLLHNGCEVGNLEVVKFLIEQSNINYRTLDNDGVNILMYAAMHDGDNSEVLSYLMTKCEDLDLNATDVDGNTIAHWSARDGHPDTIKYLLELGTVDFEARNSGGRTPLDEACYYDTKSGRELETVVDSVELLLKFDSIDVEGLKAIHDIAMDKEHELLKALVVRHPEIVNLPSSEEGCTVLHILCFGNYFKTLEYFMANEDLFLDFNIRTNETEFTPLHLAVKKGNLRIVELILANAIKRNIDVAQKSNDGHTALELARQEGHTKIAEMIRLWNMRLRVVTP